MLCFPLVQGRYKNCVILQGQYWSKFGAITGESHALSFGAVSGIRPAFLTLIPTTPQAVAALVEPDLV